MLNAGVHEWGAFIITFPPLGELSEGAVIDLWEQRKGDVWWFSGIS